LIAYLGLVGDQRVRGIDAELRLGRARGRAAAQPCELLAQQLAPAVVARGRLTIALGAGEDVRGIAAVVLMNRLGDDLPRRRTDGVPGTSGRG
jgi:hypothetical protein